MGRDLAQIAVGLIGSTIGGNPAMGFAIATTLFSIVVPPSTPDLKTPKIKNQGDQSTSVDSPAWQIYGTYEREGAELLRVGKDASGQRSGIEEVERTENTGGGSGGLPTGQVKKTVSYLHCSVSPCAGFTRIDRLIEKNNTDGQKVVYDRFNSMPTEDSDTLRALLADLEANANNLPACEAIQADLLDFYAANAEKQGIVFTPVFGPVTGQLIAELSDTVDMYFGGYEQTSNSTEAEWYPEGVSADRGKVKVVYKRYGPLESGTSFLYLLVSPIKKRRDIIKHRLTLAGIPESRIFLDSIDPDAEEDGWYVDAREPARNLAEQVAAVSFHDIGFMPRKEGLCFTDISRANPTYFVLEYEESGAYSNTNGNGEIPSIVNNNIQTPKSKPRQFSTSFNDANANFKKNSVVSVWTSAIGPPQQVTLRCVSGAQKIQDFNDIAMAELQAAEGTEQIALMPNRSEVACGCVLVKPEPTDNNPGAYRLLRVISQSVSVETIITCTCVPYDPAAYGRARTLEIVPEDPPTITVYGKPITLFIDGVSLLDFMADAPTVLIGAYVEAGESWRGALVTNESRAFESINLTSQAIVGELLTDYDFNDADLTSRNYDTVVRVSLIRGTLASTSYELAAQGANLLYAGGVYFNFQTITPVDETTADITGLMPAIKGSDDIRHIETGAQVIQITDHENRMLTSLAPAKWALSKLRVPVTYQTYSAADTSKTLGPQTVTVQGNTLKALAAEPFVYKTDDGSDGYFLGFNARTRYAESQEAFWNGIPVRWSDPLSFRVRLFDGVDMVDERTVTGTTGAISVHYTEAELIAAFGSVPATLDGDITQNGTYGPGYVREFTGV